MISSPVTILDPTGRLNILGTVTIGLTIGDSFLNTLSDLTKCSIGIVSQLDEFSNVYRFSKELKNRSITSTEKQQLSMLSPAQKVQQLTISGEKYLVIITPFFSNRVDVNLLLMTSLDNALRPILRPTQQALLLIGILALLTSLVFSYWMSRSISSPITKLVSAANNVSNGDLDTPIDIQARDEIGDLAASFEEMRHSLQQNIESLQKTYARLMVSEKLAAAGKLMAHLSHELNNPIHNIHSALEAGLKKLKQEDREMIDVAYDEILRLERLVRQTLDFYRPGTGEKESVNLNNLLEEMINISRESLKKTNIKIHTQYDKELSTVLGNRDQLKQVFLNLFLNARDAMHDGGDIYLETENADGNVLVRVRDTGPGIAPEKRDKIFDAFYTTKSQVSGVGLGLSVCYELVNRHGGAIILNSDYHKGAEFFVRLPVAGEV